MQDLQPRPSEDDLKGRESAFKKCTALVKKLAKIQDGQLDSITRELRATNLTRYVAEARPATVPPCRSQQRLFTQPPRDRWSPSLPIQWPPSPPIQSPPRPYARIQSPTHIPPPPHGASISLPQCVTSIAECAFKTKDAQCVVAVCGHLHRDYDSFAPQLIQASLSPRPTHSSRPRTAIRAKRRAP